MARPRKPDVCVLGGGMWGVVLAQHLAERGAPGEIYNVCSGTPVRMADVLRQLVMIARVGLEIREDPALMRGIDTPIVYGDNAKVRAATGWAPTFTLARSLRDIYEDARASAGVP